MPILNWTNQCWLFMTVLYIMRSVRMTTHRTTEPSAVTHARDYWWTLDFANFFLSPGVNSRAELVPSHGAPRRWLGDKSYLNCTNYREPPLVRQNLERQKFNTSSAKLVALCDVAATLIHTPLQPCARPELNFLVKFVLVWLICFEFYLGFAQVNHR